MIYNFRYAIIWTVFILIVCGINGSNLPKIKFTFTFGIDKLAHLFLFGIQAWLITMAYWKLNKSPLIYYAFLAAILSSVFGVIVEILQATVFINRTFDYEDMVANAMGAFLCLPFSYLLRKKV